MHWEPQAHTKGVFKRKGEGLWLKHFWKCKSKMYTWAFYTLYPFPQLRGSIGRIRRALCSYIFIFHMSKPQLWTSHREVHICW